MNAYTDEDVQAGATDQCSAWHGLQRPCARCVYNVRAILDAVAPAIVARAKAEALRGAADFVAQLRTLNTTDIAEYLRDEADQFERGQ